MKTIEESENEMKTIEEIVHELKYINNDPAVDYGLDDNLEIHKTEQSISKDGTLTITVDDATKVSRILVQDNKNNGRLFYGDSN